MNQQEGPLDVGSYPVAPEGLELEQVHIYVRHGERTPVRVRMSDPPASIPADWQLCNTSKTFHETVAGYNSTDDGLWYKKVVENRFGIPSEGLCLLGELTDVGKRTTHSFGAALRGLYVGRLKFLPPILDNEHLTYFRSTNIARTIESLQHIVHGLYPPSACAPGTIPPVIIRNGVDENLVSNTLACKRLAHLELQFAQAAVATWNSQLQSLDNKVSKYIGGKPLRLDGTPRASGILDTVRSAAAHGFQVPLEFLDDNVMNLIETAVTDEWFGIFKSEEGRRLGMGRLLADISKKMQQKTQPDSKDPTKLLVHTTHDSTLAALLCTFDVFDNKWPPFTSSVMFELFRKQGPPEQQTKLQRILSFLWRKSPSEHYVRMRYKNRNMVLPICAAPGNHLPGSPEFCTFSAFQERVKELTPKDWDSECLPRT